MNAQESNRIGIELINGLSILILSLALALFTVGCRQSTERPDPGVDSEPAKLCGECLELPKAEICSVAGTTLRNSCEAICRGQRILCNGECPCPED